MQMTDHPTSKQDFAVSIDRSTCKTYEFYRTCHKRIFIKKLN